MAKKGLFSVSVYMNDDDFVSDGETVGAPRRANGGM